MKDSQPPPNFTRGQFLKLTAGLIGSAAGAYALYEWAPWLNQNVVLDDLRKPLEPSASGKEEWRELVRYATLAASGHNTQPWKFHLADQTIQIHPDFYRRLRVVDPNDRELWISLGCALENLCLAAKSVGFEPEVTYPLEHDFISVQLKPRSAESGTLFAAIPTRQNTRSLYDGSQLDTLVTREMMSVPLEQAISIKLLDSKTQTESVIEYVSEGNFDQFNDRAFMDELIRWIRFDKREAMKTRDGLYSLSSGSPQSPRAIGAKLLSRMTPQSQVDSDVKKMRSSSGMILIASDTDDKADWVRTGQVYQRLALTMTSLDIKSAFQNQPIEVPRLRNQFQSLLGLGSSFPQLLLRFGRADALPASFRRPVDDVIVLA